MSSGTTGNLESYILNPLPTLNSRFVLIFHALIRPALTDARLAQLQTGDPGSVCVHHLAHHVAQVPRNMEAFPVLGPLRRGRAS